LGLNYKRKNLGRIIAPNESISTEIELIFNERGNFKINLDLVSEQIV
jgi:hypothetical protein